LKERGVDAVKWKEEGVATRKELVSYINGVAGRLATRALSIEDQPVVVPDAELHYTLKYKEEGTAGTLTLKVEWGEEPEEEEPEEEKEEEEG